MVEQTADKYHIQRERLLKAWNWPGCGDDTGNANPSDCRRLIEVMARRGARLGQVGLAHCGPQPGRSRRRAMPDAAIAIDRAEVGDFTPGFPDVDRSRACADRHLRAHTLALRAKGDQARIR